MYSGKALAAFEAHARAHPDAFRGKTVLFWHTGGALGLFDKADQLAALLPKGQVQRLDVALPTPAAPSSL